MARPRDPSGVVLTTMLHASGVEWSPPYEDFRRLLGTRRRTQPVEPELQEQADSRLRTYLTLFRGMGLVLEADGVLTPTRMGEQLAAILDGEYQLVDAVASETAARWRRRIAKLVAPAISRYQLASPLATGYPEGTNIHPLRAILKAMRALDDRIHWDELDRTLTTCLTEESVDEAIARIAAARATVGYDPNDPAAMESLLGPRVPEVTSQADRVDVWLSRAGFKNIFVEQRDRTDGYRYLNGEFIDLVDELLALPVENFSGTTVEEYVNWLGATSTELPADDASSSYEQQVARVLERCAHWGSKRIITLIGPAGSGKTSVAQRAAAALTGDDDTKVKVVQFHAAFSYEEFVGGYAPTTSGTFEPRSGALLEINSLAKDDPENTYVLLIDELSRADVANVLGELLTYVEYRDRWFSVQSLGRIERIAPNLVIMATMNPTDRSVVDMDDALVRRLIQIEIPPSPAALRSILTEGNCDAALIDQVVSWFEGLPSDTPFAHGLFVGVSDENDLKALWNEQLRFFLWRGGLVVYPNPEAIEEGFVWRL